MSTDFFKKYINIIEEAQQLNELSPDLLRRASDAAGSKRTSLAGPENKAARQKASGQEEKFYQGQVDRSNANPVAGTQATANAYAEKLKQNGWNQITNPQQIQQAAASLGWDKYSQPPQGVIWFTHSQSGEAAYIDPKNGQLVRSNNTQQRVGHSFGNAKSMHPAASDSQKWNANNPNQNIFQPTKGVAENANVSNIRLKLTGPQSAISMNPFYDLNKRLADLSAKQDAAQLAESKQAKTVAQSPLTQALNEGQAKRLPGLPITKKDVEKKFGGSMIKMAQAAKDAGFSNARIAQAMDDLKQGKNPNDVAEAGYSAKAGRAGKDLGKPGKNFEKIAKGAAERYGSKEAGERVAGAVLNKLRHPKEEKEMDESALQAYLGNKKYGEQGMKALQKAGREHAGKAKMDQIRNRYDKMDEADIEEGMFGFGMPKTSVSNNRLMVQGDQKAGDKVMAALQKANPQLAAQGKHSGASGPDGPQYLGIQFATPQLAQQAAQALQGGMEEGNAFTAALKATPKGGKFKVGGKEFKDTSNIEEGSMKRQMEADAERMSREKFCSKYGDKYGEFWDNCMGNLDEGFKEMDAWLASREKEKGTGRFDKRKVSTGTVYTRKPETFDDPETDPEATGGAPARRGRPKGRDKGPERVTAKSYKYKAGRPAKTQENLDSDGVMMTRPSNMSSEGISHGEEAEYNDEAGMTKDSLHTIMRHARELEKCLRQNENLPEWVQEKVGQIKGMMTSVTDYILSTHERDAEQHMEPMAEKSVSKAQRKAAGIAHAAQKGEIPKSKLRGASKEMAKMPQGELHKFAATKEKGLPKKVKEGGKPDFLDLDKDGNKTEPMKKAAKEKSASKEEKVDETTVAGSVATAPAGKKSSGGYNFGGGVYEGFNTQVESMITEGMNVTVNMTAGEDGQTHNSITVTAEGEEADQLATLLKMAGLHGQACDSCGQAPCGCEQTVDEAYGDTDETLNNPDWPTDTEKLDAEPNLRTYSGGLNGPKSTGQTTIPVVASQLRRQSSMEESVALERSLFKTWKNYKG